MFDKASSWVPPPVTHWSVAVSPPPPPVLLVPRRRRRRRRRGEISSSSQWSSISRPHLLLWFLGGEEWTVQLIVGKTALLCLASSSHCNSWNFHSKRNRHIFFNLSGVLRLLETGPNGLPSWPQFGNLPPKS